MNLTGTIGQMSCNPAMGGNLQRADCRRDLMHWGGYSGIVSDVKAAIQFKDALNIS